MACPNSPRRHFRFHKWKKVAHYPSEVSDGAGGYWACHLVYHCSQCGAVEDGGIWAASENMHVNGGKSWAIMRSGRQDELEKARESWLRSHPIHSEHGLQPGVA